MTDYCEITCKRPAKAEGPKPSLLKRKIDVPELKTSIRLRVSEEGLNVLKEKGGLKAFLKDRNEKNLSQKLMRVKSLLGLPTDAEVKKQAEEKAAAAKKAEEAAAAKEAKAAEEAAAKEAKAAEAAAAKEAKAAEAAKEEAPAEEAAAPAEENAAPEAEAKEETPAKEAAAPEEKAEAAKSE